MTILGTGLGAIGLAVTTVIIAALLLSLNLRAAWSWPVKAGAVVLTSSFYAVAYFSLLDLPGWPSAAPLPEEFLLLGAEVREPDKRRRTAGAIYLWARATGDADAQPRAYRLPYSRALHEAVLEAQTRRASGSHQAGRVESAPGSGAGSVDPSEPGIRFFEPPRSTLPEKRRR